MAVDAIGTKAMSWGEAIRHTRTLAAMPDSHVQAAIRGWQYPASIEAITLMHIYDRTVDAHFKKADHYAKPWPDRSRGRRIGQGTSIPLHELKRRLAAHRAADDTTEGVTHG